MARKRRPAPAAAELRVVGIGASAGGIEALEALFDLMPAASRLAFVIVQHRTEGPSRLARLFARWTPMPIRDAADGVGIEPGCIYIAPPGQALTVERSLFATRAYDGASPRPGNDTIDTFFESLAREFGPRSIAVVLSGTGADGAAGAVAIRQAGGLVMVQDPGGALYDGMPISAIANGAAHHVLSLVQLAHKLIECDSPAGDGARTTSWSDDTTMALKGIVEMVHKSTGSDLSEYKSMPLVWRIQRRMEQRRVSRFTDYETLLREDPAELETLARAIPLHVSEFFRDPDAWLPLEHEVIPRIFQEAGQAPVRAWTAACATGHEAYSLAMLLAEHAESLKPPGDFQLFATDASAEIVARASRGVFTEHAVATLPPERRERFFHPVDGTWRVTKALRSKMVFAPQDLLADPPFQALDIVSCRNLLIYLEPPAARRVIHYLHSSLRMGGYLFLGKGEALYSRQRDGFDEIAKPTRIYRKTGAMPADVPFPKRPSRLRAGTPTAGVVAAHAHAAALDASRVPAVLVDEHLQILRIHGDTGPFLRLQPGEPSLNLLRLLSTSAGLEMAAKDALARGLPVTMSALPDPTTGEPTLSLRITPMPAPEGGSARLLVSFLRDPASTGPAHRSDADWGQALRLGREELEASRQELQAVNEELRASNDQLNAANDDLNDANLSLREKVAALQTQSDVLTSSAAMTLYLDGELRVGWFTPAIVEVLPLRKGDIGRRISDLTPKFDRPEFIDDIRAVMRDGEMREAEVRTRDGRWYLERIRPFHAADTRNPGGGVAITFADVTDRKATDDALRASEVELRRSQGWLVAQNEAFQSAMNGAPLAESLAILIRAAIEQSDGERRCAFYIADPEGTELHHVVGMPEDSPGEGDRGRWSFPIETSAGKCVGSFAMYFAEQREPTVRDRELASLITWTAAIIISHAQP